MNTFEYVFHGVGDKVVDTLLLYALSDLAIRADAKVELHWSLGHGVILTLQSSSLDLQDRMIMVLRKTSKSYTIANRLKFWLNVGGGKGGGWSADPLACVYCGGKKSKKFTCDMKGNCGAVGVPAYSIFFRNLSELKTIDLNDTRSLSKNRQVGYKTLYIGLSPYWSKGIRTWDSQWDGSESTYLPTQLQVLLLYGLAHYATSTFADTFIQLIFSPPFGADLESKDAILLLELVKRMINRFSLGVRRIQMNNLPVKTIPLTLLSQLDLPSLAGVSREQLSLLFIAYDTDRAVPKNPRGYEEWSLAEAASFYLELGAHFWDFKCMIADLATNVWREELRSRIQSILLDLSHVIYEKNIWLLNDALFKIHVLSHELRIHLPKQDAILKAQRILE